MHQNHLNMHQKYAHCFSEKRLCVPTAQYKLVLLNCCELVIISISDCAIMICSSNLATDF